MAFRQNHGIDESSTPSILVKGSRDPSVKSQRHFSILISI